MMDNIQKQLNHILNQTPQPIKTSAIEPAHYRKGDIDLYESWYRTYPLNEFRAGMQMIAERYIKRDKNDRVEDLRKAAYTIERLIEYEEMEAKK